MVLEEHLHVSQIPLVLNTNESRVVFIANLGNGVVFNADCLSKLDSNGRNGSKRKLRNSFDDWPFLFLVKRHINSELQKIRRLKDGMDIKGWTKWKK